MIKSPIVTALNAVSYTAISMSGGENGRYNIAYYTEDGSGFYIATDSSGTDEALIPADSSVEHEMTVKSDDILFYAKAVSGTPNLVVLTAH